MENGIYVYYDDDYLSALNLPREDFATAIIVYKSAMGQTGFHADAWGIILLRYLLKDSISINKSEKVIIFDSTVEDAEFASAISVNSLAIQNPSQEIIAAVNDLQEYHKKRTIANTYIRLGKLKELPKIPLLEELKHVSLPKFGEILRWLSLRSRSVSIWNRFSAVYGTQPTYLIKANDDFIDRLRTECSSLDISFHIVEAEADLPCW